MKNGNSDEYSRLGKFDKWDKEDASRWHVLEFEADELESWRPNATRERVRERECVCVL